MTTVKLMKPVSWSGSIKTNRTDITVDILNSSSQLAKFLQPLMISVTEVLTVQIYKDNKDSFNFRHDILTVLDGKAFLSQEIAKFQIITVVFLHLQIKQGLLDGIQIPFLLLADFWIDNSLNILFYILRFIDKNRFELYFILLWFFNYLLFFCLNNSLS